MKRNPVLINLDGSEILISDNFNLYGGPKGNNIPQLQGHVFPVLRQNAESWFVQGIPGITYHLPPDSDKYADEAQVFVNGDPVDAQQLIDGDCITIRRGRIAMFWSCILSMNQGSKAWHNFNLFVHKIMPGKIIYRGYQSGGFSFSVREILNHLEEERRNTKAVRGWYLDAFLFWLHFQMSITSGYIRITAPSWGEMSKIAADFIPIGKVDVFCHDCNRHISHSSIREEAWGFQIAPLAGGGGSQYFCDQNHILLKIQDWIS